MQLKDKHQIDRPSNDAIKGEKH